MSNKAGAEVVKSGGKKQRYGVCFAPSEYLGSDSAQLWGWWAEDLIMANYRKKTGAVPMVTDWLDLQVPTAAGQKANPLNNPVRFFEFLVLHHPDLHKRGNEWLTEFNSGRTAVPDILAARTDRHDYYEIKPGSTSGISAGVTKLEKLGELFPRFALPVYKRGKTYTPGRADDIDITGWVPQRLRAWGLRAGLTRAEVTLTFRRDPQRDGLILYWICADLESEDDLEEAAVENVARWYALEGARKLRKERAVSESQIEIEYAKPAVKRLILSPEVLGAAILTAGPATEYAIIGGRLAVAFVNEAERAEHEQLKARQQQFVKEVIQIERPGIPQLYRHPTAINEGGFDYKRAIAILKTVIAVEVIVGLAPFAIAGAAFGAPAGAAGAIGGAEAGAAGVGAIGGAEAVGAGGAALAAAPLVTSTVIATGEAAQAAGGAAFIAQFSVQASAALVANSNAVSAAAAAGVLLVLGMSRNAVAGPRTNRAAVPFFEEVEGVFLVPMQDVPEFAIAGPLGGVSLPGGKRGIRLGSVRLSGADATTPELESSKPKP